MPSISTRTTKISSTHVRATPNPVGVGAPALMPTPQPPYVGRNPTMISSLPTIGTAEDASLRQFYGGRNLPFRRLTR